MIRLLPVLLVVLLRIRWTIAEGFVEEVACRSDGFTVVLNKSEPVLASLIADPKAEPVVYVYAHRDRVQCGSVMKNGKDQNFNLTVPYGPACDVLLTDLQPNYKISETTIVLESNRTSAGKSVQVLNQVHCTYPTSVRTIKINEVGRIEQPEVKAISVGRPLPKVDMHFRDVNGGFLHDARFGETIEFYLALTVDNAYHAILPRECAFSDREDMQSAETHRLTFVQNSCPVRTVSDIIDPLQHVNHEVFFTKFATFRFGNQSTVFIHCTVQVCMKASECTTSCFKEINNSQLNAERVRFARMRRASGPASSSLEAHGGGLAEVTGNLYICDDNDERPQCIKRQREGLTTVAATCPAPILGLSTVSLSVFVAVLCVVAATSVGTIAFLLWRLNKRSKESNFELYSAAQLRSMANSTACLTDARHIPSTFPLHVNTSPPPPAGLPLYRHY